MFHCLIELSTIRSIPVSLRLLYIIFGQKLYSHKGNHPRFPNVYTWSCSMYIKYNCNLNFLFGKHCLYTVNEWHVTWGHRVELRIWEATYRTEVITVEHGAERCVRYAEISESTELSSSQLSGSIQMTILAIVPMYKFCMSGYIEIICSQWLSDGHLSDMQHDWRTKGGDNSCGVAGVADVGRVEGVAVTEGMVRNPNIKKIAMRSFC